MQTCSGKARPIRVYGSLGRLSIAVPNDRLGQSRYFGDVRVTSALPLKADIHPKGQRVSNVPNAEIGLVHTSGSVQRGAPTIEATMPRVTPVAMFLEIH